MSKPSWPPLTGPRSWTCFTIYTPHTRSLWPGRGRVGALQETIDRWLWPDPFRNQDTSVSKAKQAISQYKKAVGDPAGLTELLVFYCEQAAGYCQDIGYQEEGFFDALVRMFEQALQSAKTLPADGRDSLIVRLNRVREIGHAFGYGVGDDMDYLWTKYAKQSR